MSHPAPILSLTDISKTFPGVKALDRARLNIYPGQVMALIGENGAGKSTLMKVLTGIYQADSGTLTYDGQQVWFNGPYQSQHAGISIIHQELNLIPELSIAENIFLGREPTTAYGRIKWSEMARRAGELLQQLGVRHSPRKAVGELSIGTQQMVEIAKALSFESRVIIMDEPSDALTDTETQALFNVIRELKQQGRGIVYISHRLAEIFTICDDVTVMRDGQFIHEGPVSELTEDSLIEKMVGRKLDEQYPHLPYSPGSTVLELKQVRGPGVNGADLTVHSGEIVGISGLMGAGRTELMKILYGAAPRHSGEVRLEGRAIHPHTPSDGVHNGILYISEDRKGDGLVLGLSVEENMTLSALTHFCRNGGWVLHNQEHQAVDDFIRMFAIKTPSRSQQVGLLSGGNQQKVAIAKGLLCRPKVLILDEPTRGVDVGAKKEIYQLINQFKQQGMSILLVSSDMPEVLGMSDRIVVMHEGRITGEFTREQATQEALLACAVGKSVEELVL